MEENTRKKRKFEASEDVENEKEGKTQKLFSAELFRKELNQQNLFVSLKEFLNLAQQEKNGHIVTEYLEAGGSVQEILLLLDKTARSDLTSALPVFKVLHLIFLSVKGKDSKFYTEAEAGARFMLDSFLQTIEAMLNIHSNKHRKAVLKVLTSIVTLFPLFGREVISLVPSTPAVLSQFLQPQSGPDSVRKWFIFFILSFIISGDIVLIRSLMSMKGLLSDIMIGLKNDEAQTVNMFLFVVKEKILENIKVSKTSKLQVFYTQVIVSLFELYYWKELKNTNMNTSSGKKMFKVKVVNKEEKNLVTESVHAFLLVLCTSKKFGVAFSDNTFGTTGEEKNSLLSTVIQSIPEPWEKKRMSEVVIAIVQACPDLMKVTLSITESAIQPRESKKWITLIQFIENLLEAVSPKEILMTAVEIPEIDVVRVAKQFCSPPHLITQMSLGVRKKNSLPMLYYSMRILTVIWRKTKEVLAAFEGQQKLEKALTMAYTNCFSFLELDEILAIWENVCNSRTMFESVEKQQFLNVILEYIEMGLKLEEESIDWPNRITVRMLDALDSIYESLGDIDYLIIQSRIFYLVVTVDPTSVTPDTDLFRKAIKLLLTNNSKTAIESIAKIILATGVFKNNETEIDIWLACYFENFQEYQHSIPEAFTNCICRLYNKQVASKRGLTEDFSKSKEMSSELKVRHLPDLTKEKQSSTSITLTPMLAEFLEMLKGLKKMKDVREYVSRITLRLYHYYNTSASLLKFCDAYKNEIADTVLTYISGGDIAALISDDSVFLTKVEKKLMAWIFKKKKHINLDSAFTMEDTYNFSLFLPFNTVTSYLITRVKSDSLSDDDVTKLGSFFSFFMNFGSEVAIESSESILSYDVDDPCVLRKKCLQCLFSLPLIDKFNVCEFENKTVMNFTKIITKIIMEFGKKNMANLFEFQPWKQKILDTIKKNVYDSNKTMGIIENLEHVLNLISYTSGEISEVLRVYSSITDIKTFVVNGQITISTVILAKFVKFQSEFSETSEITVKQLENIITHMIENGATTDLNVLDDCFVCLLKNRPRSASLVTNDLLEILLRRSESSENAITLCKLLLCDPVRIHHFIQFATKSFKELKNKDTIVAMLSSLIVQEEDLFLELLRSRKFCLYWKESELVGKGDESEVSQLMRVIYKKYKKYILMEKSRHIEFVLQHEKFFALLAKCFMDKESLSDMRNNILKGSFLPEIIHETILLHNVEDDISEAYAQGLLVICSEKLKEAENGTCDESVWFKYGKYIGDLVNLKRKCCWKAVTNSAIWKDFVRLSLRICFNFPNCPSFIRTITHFIELFSERENARAVKTIFDMLISHSQFLNVMLGESLLKHELVKLYYSLIKRNSEVLSIKHIPVILASYTASLSESDVILISILRFYEEHNLNMNEYEPVVWGEPAIAHYSVKTNVGMSLWRRINMLNVLEMLDPKRMIASLKEFPVTRTGKVGENVDYNEKVYDPAFLLPIFANLLSPGAVTYCLPFVQKGCFAYTIRALSNIDKDIRITASVVLARFYNHLELVQMMKLKSVWLHFINCLRFAIHDIEAKPIPSVVTYFLSQTSLELSGEPGQMYTSLQRFLLAKPVFSFDCIPEFLPLFHSSDVNYMKHRRWILEILRDGFKRNNDLDLLFRTMAVKIILSYFKSEFCTRELKPLVLEVVTIVLKTEKSKLLISEYGLLTWLNSISLSCAKELFPPFIKLLSAATAVTKRELFKNLRGKRNLFYPIQILNILMKIIPNLSECRSPAIVESYLTILFDCLLIMFQLSHKTWCKLNRSKLCLLNNIVASVSDERRIGDRYVNLKYFATYSDVTNDLEKLYRRIVFLWDVLSRRESDV